MKLMDYGDPGNPEVFPAEPGCMIPPRYSKRGTLSFWYILPSEPMKQRVIRHLRRYYPMLNYLCDWRDSKGFGLHFTVADWVRPGSIYVVPD